MSNEMITGPEGFDIPRRLAKTKVKAKSKNTLRETVKSLATFGFQNLNASDEKDGEGDGLWYPLDSKKRTRHDNDPVMSLAQAKAMGVKIGKG